MLHLDISGIDSKEVQHLNKDLILVTFIIFQYEKSFNDIKESQSLNIEYILVIDLASINLMSNASLFFVFHLI